MEIIVIDGGSTDGTLELLQKAADEITLISEPDSGQANAINKGFFLAHGKILAWLNADDIYLPGAVGAAVQAFEENPEVCCVYGDCAYVDAEGERIAAYPARSFDLHSLVVDGENFIPQPATFFRRACLDKVGMLDEELDYVLDYELWLRFTRVGNFLYLPEPLAQTRLHAGAKSVASFASFGDELIGVIEDYFDHPDLPAALAGAREEAISKASLRAAHAALWAEEYAAALRHNRRAAWKYLTARKRATSALIWVFGLLGRAGVPAGRLLARLRENPYTMGQTLRGRDG